MTDAQLDISRDVLTILVVDDDEADRKHMLRALKRTSVSCACIETASVKDALAACKTATFDCAIVDYRLPGYNGLQGISALHEQQPHMPIIMATAHGDEMVATEAMKRGASDYIAKAHITPESIGHCVESALEKAALRRKLAQQRDELENFSRVLAHDLSAPVASLQLFARVIEEDLKSVRPKNTEIIKHCRQLVSAGQRAGALIDSIFEYTKADAVVAFGPVEMMKVMECVLLNLKCVIDESGSLLTYGELPVVVGSLPQLTQLLQNLISNSIKYCEASPPKIHVVARPEAENSWRFVIKDNGIGIPEKDQQRIFEPFRRLHDTSKYQGTGLGLATCKKIISRHGGVIGCESKVGEGTTFFFTLQGAQR